MESKFQTTSEYFPDDKDNWFHESMLNWLFSALIQHWINYFSYLAFYDSTLFYILTSIQIGAFFVDETKHA